MTKHFRFIAVAMIAVSLAACTAKSGPPEFEPGSPAATGARCDGRIDAAFGAWARAGFSGSIAISTGGRFDCLASYGSADEAAGTPNTVDTVFSIGSVSKAFTAATVFRLADDRKLALDDRVGTILPELTGPVAGVTVRQLLLHTSGLNGTHGTDHKPLDRAGALSAIGGLKLAFAPGTGYVYSNAGYTLLALVIEKVSGRSYRDYTMAEILTLPDGRVAGGFWDGQPAAPGPRAVGRLDGGQTGESGGFAGPHWAVDGNGGLAMTTRDLAAWTHALFTGRLVSAASVQAIGTPGHDLGKGRSETPGWVAYDASVYGKPFLTTAGGGGDIGHNAVVVWVPEGERVIAMASNRPEVNAEKLLEKVGPALLADAPLPTPSPPPGGTAPAATVGKYRLETGGGFEVTAAGNQMSISASGADAVAALFPPRGVSADELRRHEERVLALLDGETQEGRKERKALETAFGRITGITPGGTVVRDGELRSYVTVTTDTRTVLGWFAVNQKGGVEAAEVDTGPPTLTLTPAGAGRYRPDDPTGSGPEVVVEFGAGRLTVTGPGGPHVAKLAG
ncbi:serine hydrolase domain-containing protein [Plantactinospora sp. KLBMP9567]|uniref:serine hydrolase domain-containing protein n=1 Tax=Plantactinospora sp. KLBMP9567 TaxID=3085900 RepID=UPI0029810771|nr:serine hydrolase domain-containing protein [Plantactinospora sp. KLBMP9567]MDW5326299.1 serine hydrolase domain-containing protein [Plantactinospora sp. KLBMP9567]